MGNCLSFREGLRRPCLNQCSFLARKSWPRRPDFAESPGVSHTFRSMRNVADDAAPSCRMHVSSDFGSSSLLLLPPDKQRSISIREASPHSLAGPGRASDLPLSHAVQPHSDQPGRHEHVTASPAAPPPKRRPWHLSPRPPRHSCDPPLPAAVTATPPPSMARIDGPHLGHAPRKQAYHMVPLSQSDEAANPCFPQKGCYFRPCVIFKQVSE